jgi:hypothetical protein
VFPEVDMSGRSVGLACVTLLLLPLNLRADPITVVSGDLTTQVFSSYATFILNGADGSTFSGRWPGTSLACSPCLQGTSATFNSTFLYDVTPFVGGDPFASGTATVNGTAYPSLFFSGALQFSTTASPIPNFQANSPNTELFSFTQPFTFAGTVSGFDRLLQGPTELSPVFTSSLTGNGTATIDLIGAQVGDRTILTYFRTTYDFAAAPTPEPATVVLCGIGLSVLGIRRFGRHLRRHS